MKLSASSEMSLMVQVWEGTGSASVLAYIEKADLVLTASGGGRAQSNIQDNAEEAERNHLICLPPGTFLMNELGGRDVSSAKRGFADMHTGASLAKLL